MAKRYIWSDGVKVGEEEIPDPPKLVDAFEFKSRFTPAERAAIRTAAVTDAGLFDFVDMLDSAIQARVAISTETGSKAELVVQALIAAGTIHPNRKVALLA
jgi:hypothetical protein